LGFIDLAEDEPKWYNIRLVQMKGASISRLTADKAAACMALRQTLMDRNQATVRETLQSVA
jgi:hypothetical protein